MPEPLRIKDFGCQQLSFECRVKEREIDIAKLRRTLSEQAPKARHLKRLPMFLPVDPINHETDCHLHFSLRRGRQSNGLDLELELMPVRQHRPPVSEILSIERIRDWFGGALRTNLSGLAFVVCEYGEPPYRPVIPLPRSGIVPVESALIRRSSISGIEISVEESDVGLRRVFLSRPTPAKIYLNAIFRFSHELNYGLFGQLVNRARKIAELFVVKEPQQ